MLLNNEDRSKYILIISPVIRSLVNPASFSREVDLINSAKINVFLNGDHWKADNKSIFTLMSQVCLLEFDLKT